jgi:hypothetical protein
MRLRRVPDQLVAAMHKRHLHARVRLLEVGGELDPGRPTSDDEHVRGGSEEGLQAEHVAVYVVRCGTGGPGGGGLRGASCHNAVLEYTSDLCD